MFFPSCTTKVNTFCCSALSTTFCLIFIVEVDEELELERLVPADPVRAMAFFAALQVSAVLFTLLT